MFKIPKQKLFFIYTHFVTRCYTSTIQASEYNVTYTIYSIILLPYITYIYKASGHHIFHIPQKDFKHYYIPNCAILIQAITPLGNFTYN
jgi:hypothetical protein